MLIPNTRIPILSQKYTCVVNDDDFEMKTVITEKGNSIQRLFTKTVTVEKTNAKVSMAAIAGEQRFVDEAERLGYLPNEASTKYYVSTDKTEFLILFSGFSPVKDTEYAVDKLNIFELSFETNIAFFVEQIILTQINIFVPKYVYESFSEVGLG